MKRILCVVSVLIMVFTMTACGGKKDAYDKFVGLVNEGNLTEAQDYWEQECEAIFGDKDYEDIAHYRDYVRAVADYKAGEPIRLSTRISILSDVPKDFLDTADVIEEMDDILDDMEGKYVDYSETYYGNVAKLKLDGEEFSFSMGSLGDDGVVNWAIENGNVKYGVTDGSKFRYTIEFTDKGVEVSDEEDIALYSGTYIKE